MTAIVTLIGREILDSRGNPTVEVDALLEDGSLGRAAVPSGASTGRNEALELRDGDPTRYLGKGVTRAIGAVNGEILEAVRGLDAEEQWRLDQIMIDLDGTPNKARLGANAILGVSLALARASAVAAGVSLYRYLGGMSASLLPVPMMNILNGGAHADNPMDFQEFMICPLGAATFAEGVRIGSEIFHTLQKALRAEGESTNVGDEGGFAPNLRSATQALDYIVAAIETAGHTPGDDVAIALDPAASEFFHDGEYVYAGEAVTRSVEEHVNYLEELVAHYPIVSIEDPVAEDDFAGWKLVTEVLGPRCQLVGDDVFCTDSSRLSDGVRDGIANSILIKVNQVGSLSETLETVETARRAGYSSVISHRSGETEDTSVADIAVATNCGQIKTGSLSRVDRTAKYNQLIRIEQELGAQARYAGRTAAHQLTAFS